MARMKPTILISLDPHAAAFCERAQAKLERDLGYSGSLVRSYGLIAPGDADPSLEKNLSAIADFAFQLSAPANDSKPSAEEAQADFESKSAGLEPELSEILEAGRRAAEIEKARQLGIELARNRLVYLVLSSADAAAGGVVIELARLIRWLFATRFTQELYELHAVVLLPDLFEQPQPAHFARAYALLKKLDHSVSTGLFITPTRRMQPFDGCWLLDGINSRGEKIGTLTEELDSFTDAFTGFLTSEPEMSGALVGTRTSRGKVPAYSAFGHGELYFPFEIAVKRLSSALSRDIIDEAFLGKSVEPVDLKRKTLLAAKQFVLGEEYRSAVNELERDKGALIWQDPPRPAELQRESNALEYVAELQRHHSQFEREALPKFKQALVARSEACRKDLIKLVDKEIDRQVDEKPQGLRDVPALLDRLVDHGIALHTNALGERPQNFITDLFAAEAMLDNKLEVQIDRSRTEALLKQVDELNNRLVDLENTLRITKPRENDSAPPEGEDEAAETLRSEHQDLLSDVEETRAEISSTSAMYVRELIAEQRTANQIRYEARDKMRASRAQTVTDTEQELARTADLLTAARLNLEDKQQQRHAFLVRHFIVYPAIAALLFLVPVLAGFLGIPFAAALVGFFLASLIIFSFSTVIALAVYSAIVLYSFMNGINKMVTAARQEVSTLELRLKAARVRLIEARSLQLRLEYDLYAQSMRVEALNNLIEVTRRRIKELETTLNSLGECRDRFTLQHKSALPSSSYMRRPVLEAADIDGYYAKVVTNVSTEAANFIRDSMPRSRVRRMPIEEFERNVEAFARGRFKALPELSIEDVLLRSPDLVSDEQASLRLEELDRAASPLVLLSEMDLNDDTFAQKDVTIWAGARDSDALLQRYRKVNSTTSIRPAENDYTLRALTRCLNFPAFYLSQIEFYRSCYDRAESKDAASLPDVIPEELTISSDSRRAYEQLLVAIATGLISRNGDGSYQLVDGAGAIMGSNRRQIAEKLALDYDSQRVYMEISNRLARSESEIVYRSVIDFLQTASDLDPFEREMLTALSHKYHPLR